MEEQQAQAQARVPKKETHVDRLKAEYSQLLERLQKLDQFLESDAFVALGAEDRKDLRQQRDAMQAYGEILVRRLNRVPVES